MPESPAKTPPLTEGELFAMLKKKLEGATNGNGPACVVIPGVRNAAGFDASRTIDAFAMSLWGSRGLLLDAYEIKSSRSDWLRELSKPDKAEAFCKLVDRFWLVVADKSIVRPGELPDGWGLLVARGHQGLTQVTAAEKLHEGKTRQHAGRKKVRELPPGFDRSFLAPLLRTANAQAAVTPEALQEAHARGYELAKADLVRDRESLERETSRHENLQREVAAFCQASGLPNLTWEGGRELGEAVMAVKNGEKSVEQLRNRLEWVKRTTQELGADIDQRLAGLDAKLKGADA